MRYVTRTLLPKHTTFAVLCALVLAACSNPEKDWEIAQRDDTPEAYLEFLARHPNTEYLEQARARVAELKVLRAWERAEFRDSENGYQDFLERFPESEQADAARQKLVEIERDAIWATLEDAESSEVVKAFIRDYPDAPQFAEAQTLLASLLENETPKPPAEPPGDFRLQLGAFRTAIAAESEVRRLVGLFPDTLAGPVRIEAPTAGGKTRLFLLKTVPMTLAEARTRCDDLKRYGQTCLVIER